VAGVGGHGGEAVVEAGAQVEPIDAWEVSGLYIILGVETVRQSPQHVFSLQLCDRRRVCAWCGGLD
jgi:hypothetical protein